MRKSRLKIQLVILLTVVNLTLTFSFDVRGSNTGASNQIASSGSVPVITGVEINAKVLTVLGENFQSGAKVLIDGEPQKTQFDSSVRLIAKKAGKRLKPGNNLQVRNPDGTISSEFLYYNAPYEIAVAANDVAYSPVTERLYASVTDRAAQYANSIAIINPSTTQVERAIPVGHQPSKLVFSDDYHFLYVVTDEGLKVQRINVSTARMDLEISLSAGFGFDDCTTAATHVSVMPGHPSTIAVSFHCAQHGNNPTVAIFDNGVRRPVVADDFFIADQLCFGSSSDTLLGADSRDTTFAMSQFKIDEQGISLVGKPVEGLLFGFNQKIEFGNGLLYTSNGRAIDPEKQTLDGRFLARETLTARSFALDVNAGRVYFGQREGFDFNVLEFDLRTYRLTRSYSAYYGLVGELDQMVRCGSAGLALVAPSGTRRIVIFPLSLLKPNPSYERPQPAPINGGVRRIPLPNYDLTYDASRQIFYASVPSLVGDYGNCIVKIDPIAGTVSDPVWVGSEPWQMAVTDDGQYLYTALFGGRAIRRLRLPDLSFDMRFPLFNDGTFFGGPMSTTASEILTMPGHPESLIVARWGDHNHIQFDSDGVAAYDNGVKRPDSTPIWFGGAPAINTIQLSPSGNAVYGLTTDSSAYTFTLMGLDARKDDVGESEIVKMRCQGGLCFTNTGLIIDPETQTRIAKIRFESAQPAFSFANWVVPDVPNNRIYYVVALGQFSLSDRGVHVLAYDLNTRLQVASFKALNEETGIANCWLWGNDQFAFSTGYEIVFFPKSLLKPVVP